MNTDLVIVGGGAAGLMAGARAGELGMRAVVVERKHNPGRKLLMCGNNRCNLTSDRSVPDLLSGYGDPVATFLSPALTAFPPQALRRWFAERGLETNVHADGRVFPASERADDVLHCLTDTLRDLGVPMVTSCPVTAITRNGEGFTIAADAITLTAARVLIATGGVSYPKTGSVGDGQKWAKALGHRLVPYRPGLAGVEFVEGWLAPPRDISIPDVALHVLSGGDVAATLNGEMLLSRRSARGPCVVNATRAIARLGLRDFSFTVDLCPQHSAEALLALLTAQVTKGRNTTVGDLVSASRLPRSLAVDWLRQEMGLRLDGAVRPEDGPLLRRLVDALKSWRPAVRRIRPLKEAMVTIGGVVLEDVDSATLESRCCPGLFFAGEVLDVDGPTGGYNLQAAFAMGRFALASLSHSFGGRVLGTGRARSPLPKRSPKVRGPSRAGRRRGGNHGTGRGRRTRR